MTNPTCPICGTELMVFGFDEDGETYEEYACPEGAESYAIMHKVYSPGCLLSAWEDLHEQVPTFATKEDALASVKTKLPCDGWISVKERLPEFDTEVLMLLPDMKAGTRFLAGEYQSEHQCDGYIMDEGWKCTAFGNRYDPTHWTPMPPAPEEVSLNA